MVPAAGYMKNKNKRAFRSDRLVPYVFLTPTLILFVCVFLFPIGFVLWSSMFKWNLMKPASGKIFVGLGNFIDLLSDNSIWNALWVTAKFVLMSVPLGILAGFCLALLLNRKFRFKRIIQALLIIPSMVAPAASYLSWKFLMEPTYGAVNYVLSLLDITGPGWFADTKTALLSVVIVDLWVNIPFIFLVLYAGLQAVPQDPLEAACVDGASKFRTLWHVTIPFMKPVILVVLIVRVMDAIRIFDNIYVLTRGGPANATRTIQFECYHLAFNSFLVGKGSALAIIIVLIILLFGSALMKQMYAANDENS